MTTFKPNSVNVCSRTVTSKSRQSETGPKFDMEKAARPDWDGPPAE